MHKFSLLFFLLILSSCSKSPESANTLSTDITPSDIKTHIAFLASDSLKGRATGMPGAAKAAHYIADYFNRFGLEPAGGDSNYYQEFTVNMAMLNNPHREGNHHFANQKHIARNVIGLVKGTDQPQNYIIIGAHFDHLGLGKFGSLSSTDTLKVHNGADDNASGTSGLLELAQYFGQHPPKKSLLFIAFSGEEIGLLGSQYFVENPTVPLDSAMTMINMDMIGRMNNNKLLIIGTGTADTWKTLIAQANTDSLAIKTVPGGTGSSDHTSFYYQNIPVLHYFTDTHSNYHRPTDDVQTINFKGEDRTLEHLKRLVLILDTLSTKQLAFTKAPIKNHRNMVIEGPTLGVMPDYGFSGEGLRITGIREGGPADKAGLQDGDIIIGLDKKKVNDIYVYMEILNTLEQDQQTTVTVSRNNTEQTFDIKL